MASKTVDNLELWNKVCKTDPNHTKNQSISGRKITAINAQYQIKNATSEFGKYGESWGLKDIEYDIISGLANGAILSRVSAIFYYPGGEFPVGTSIYIQQWISSKEYLKIDDDFVKKAETDITTKALSKLGFNADVFLGMYDNNRYVMDLKEEFNTPKNNLSNNKKTEVKIEWLTEKNVTAILKLTDAKKVEGYITKFSTDTHKMKKEFKDKLEAHLKTLKHI